MKQVAIANGKTATFMPKPVFEGNGSGMHCHQSIWNSGEPTFAGNQYSDLSETCLYYIGGILKHAKAIKRILKIRLGMKPDGMRTIMTGQDLTR